MLERRALVTGAGRRLGAAIALGLGRCGFDVALHFATSAEGAGRVAGEIENMGRRAVTLQADLLDEDQTQGLVERAAEALGGPLGLLVNNASIFEYDDIGSATAESWHRHIGSNLRAPFVLTQAFAGQAPEPAVDENEEPLARALIVNMIDQRVLKLTPEFMTYTLAKSALWTLTRTSAMALAPAVRVNAVGPGPTVRGVRQSKEHFARQRGATILQRGANADEVVKAIEYLIEAPSVTGQMICVDGGQHLGWQTPDIVGLE